MNFRTVHSIFILNFIFNYLYMSVGGAYANSSIPEEARANLQAAVSTLMWVLGIKLVSYARPECCLFLSAWQNMDRSGFYWLWSEVFGTLSWVRESERAQLTVSSAISRQMALNRGRKQTEQTWQRKSVVDILLWLLFLFLPLGSVPSSWTDLPPWQTLI